MPSIHVHLPETAYVELSRAAAEQGLSVETYVADFVQTGMADQEGYAPLTPEQLDIVDRGEADINAGRFLTMAQVRERLFANKAACLQTRPRWTVVVTPAADELSRFGSTTPSDTARTMPMGTKRSSSRSSTG